MTENKNKSLKDIVDSVKNTADELYNKPLPELEIPKDKHGGINVLPILFILVVVIIILVLIN